MNRPESVFGVLRQGKARLRLQKPIEKSNFFRRIAVSFVLCGTNNPLTSNARMAEGRRVGESPWTLPLCRL